MTMLITTEEAAKRRTRLLVIMLVITIAACGAMFIHMIRLREAINNDLAEIRLLTSDKELTTIKWHVLQLEKENDYLRKRNAELEELIASGA